MSEPQFQELLKNKRIGVLAHNASRLFDGTHLVDYLYKNYPDTLKMIFAPEHGYRSVGDDLLPDSIDPVTGLHVYSLYGPRKAPTTEMLSQLDVVLIDLQDVGVRFYTYASTVVYTLKACKDAGVSVILLDRPNPLGGRRVDGVVLEKSLVTGGFTTLASIPTQHGMTLGELARMYNETLNIHANLTVVPLKEWDRYFAWEQTGLTWNAPSPALVNAEQASLYAALGVLESANLSVGRSLNNIAAFHTYGAPWISAEKQAELVSELRKLNLSNIDFKPYSWVPNRSMYSGEFCRGFYARVIDNNLKLDNFKILMSVLRVMKSVLGKQFNTESMSSMIGSTWAVDAITTKDSIDQLIERARLDYTDFMMNRGKALLY